MSSGRSLPKSILVSRVESRVILTQLQTSRLDRVYPDGLEHHAGDSTNSLDEIWNRTEREGKIVSSDLAHKTSIATELTSTYSVCTRRVFSGIGHRTQGFRSGVQNSNH
ncbi:hypothetical protein TNCV_2991331 [Trichonephila clavipes]|uniref:Uncharacterized protein n=1 Tax=Trichonephila clavipes TaxID=2585209 RepID=A0A8X6VKE0_TRICX|nr:hypothetical protein TNCV_2991331 [Trichonephila clavipes]